MKLFNYTPRAYIEHKPFGAVNFKYTVFIKRGFFSDYKESQSAETKEEAEEFLLSRADSIIYEGVIEKENVRGQGEWRHARNQL